MLSETCIAPVNIAVIKYWGKRDEDLILPVNDSLSMTLSTDQMCAKTTAAASSEFTENRMWLNGVEVPFDENKRIVNCWEALKRISKTRGSTRFPSSWNIHICSENNFPTAAGLASSAAGYACLVYTLACLYGVEEEELTSIARLGSGSACRSIHGGFVRWLKGSKDDGTDSIAIQVQPSMHWKEIRLLVLVVNDAKKKTSSTKGMQNSVKTSQLLKHRAEVCVPQRIDAITKAINDRNFSKFAEITMKESNQFHAVGLDTFPPCVYMNDVSHSIVEFVHKYNEIAGDYKVAYTFDAGPNACLYVLEDEVPKLVMAINKVFPNDNCLNVEYVKGIPVDFSRHSLDEMLSKKLTPVGDNLLKYLIHTKIGEGPKKLSAEESLLDGNGQPKNLK